MKKQQHEEAERRLRDLGQRLRSIVRANTDDKSEEIKDALRAQHEEEAEDRMAKAEKRRSESR